ncbi:MAG: aminoacyl-tRNA hydrolase [Clostridia bacterium]|nr:aminoacyl-tRNA hydrolase [Clostridia bacterium]
MANIFDLFKSIEKSQPQGAPTHIIVGLGNPGAEYAHTRHNAGFLTLDYIAQHMNVKIDRAKFRALYGMGEISGKRVMLLKPQTYMNSSGEAVRECAAYYNIEPQNIIVISDDINLPVGKMRLRRSGSDGGQNGLKSIIYQLQSDAFPRIRIGVGQKPSPEYDLADWVLSKFSESDQKILFDEFSIAYQTLEKILDGKFDAAVALCNSGGRA